jgi:endonuclease YncB( thermonuclease family)
VLAAVVLTFGCSGALAENLSGQASVIDGDTLEIHGTRSQRCKQAPDYDNDNLSYSRS